MDYKMTTRRKLAIASWDAPREGNIYGKMQIDIEPALAYIKKLREETGEKITITHLIGKAVGCALTKLPDLNGQIVLGTYHPHNNIDVSFLVQIDEGKDLAKVKVQNINEKTLSEIAQELKEGANKLRKGTDDNFNKSTGMLHVLPTWLIKPIVRFFGYLSGVLGIECKPLGLEARPFGSCIITSVGMLGLDEAYAPPTPFARVPFYVTVLAIRKQPVVENDKIVIKEQLTVTATMDHRFIDGFQGSVLANTVRDLFAHPEKLNDVWSLEAPTGKTKQIAPANPTLAH